MWVPFLFFLCRGKFFGESFPENRTRNSPSEIMGVILVIFAENGIFKAGSLPTNRTGNRTHSDFCMHDFMIDEQHVISDAYIS